VEFWLGQFVGVECDQGKRHEFSFGWAELEVPGKCLIAAGHVGLTRSMGQYVTC
jgi:hypothetical protein